jgi:hypothetical protein
MAIRGYNHTQWTTEEMTWTAIVDMDQGGYREAPYRMDEGALASNGSCCGGWYGDGRA